MNDVRATLLGVVADLRERRLLPVAIGLILLVIVVPVVLSKPADTPKVQTPTAGTSPATVDGLPGPEQALNNDKPLVTLAVLDKPSNLQTYKGRDPFKPLVSIKAGADALSPNAGSGTAAGGSTTTAAAGGGGGGGATGDTGGTGGGSTGGGTTTPTTPTTPTKPKTKAKQFTYVIDAKLAGPSKTQRYHHLQRLAMLPTESNPLLIFLGVSSSGNSAVFLVDSKLKPIDGEGSCKPSKTQCATLRLQPGETYAFQDQAGRRYVIELDQIDRVSVASLREEAAKEKKKAKASAAEALAAGEPAPPITPTQFVPVLVDLVTGVH